jgi:hypothetical protein
MNYFSLLVADRNSSSDETAECLEKCKLFNQQKNLLLKILAETYKVILRQSGLFISGEILKHFQIFFSRAASLLQLNKSYLKQRSSTFLLRPTKLRTEMSPTLKDGE